MSSGGRGSDSSFLNPLLHDRDLRVRREALETLGMVTYEPSYAVPPLTLGLRDADVGIRRAAARGLEAVAQRIQSDRERPAIREQRAGVRTDTSPKPIPIPEWAREVRFAVHDTDAEVWMPVAHALALVGDHGGLEPLMAALQSSDAGIRAQAVSSLSLCAEAPAVEAALAAAHDPDAEVRVALARSLYRIQDPRVTEVAMALLADPDYRVRQGVLTALRDRPRQEVVPVLYAALSNEHFLVRSQAIQSLANLRDPEAIPALSAVLRWEPDDAVRAAASYAVAVLSSSPPRESPPEEGAKRGG
jgi:HEAT repeat protein